MNEENLENLKKENENKESKENIEDVKSNIKNDVLETEQKPVLPSSPEERIYNKENQKTEQAMSKDPSFLKKARKRKFLKPLVIAIILLAIGVSAFAGLYLTGNLDKVIGMLPFGETTEQVKEIEQVENKNEIIEEPIIPVKTEKEKNDIKRISDLHRLHSALEMYYDSIEANRSYPVSENLLRISKEENILSEALKEYMRELPVDPKDPEFFYGYKSDGKNYEITAVLEDQANPQCVIEGRICIFKIRNGRVVSGK